jgi:hypothetical protein
MSAPWRWQDKKAEICRSYIKNNTNKYWIVHLLVLHKLRSAFFWGITQRRVVILYRSFGTTYWPHIHGSRSLRSLRRLPDPWRWDRCVVPKRRQRITKTSCPLKMGPIRCPETSVKDYQDFLTLEDGTDKLSRNVGKGLPRLLDPWRWDR